MADASRGGKGVTLRSAPAEAASTGDAKQPRRACTALEECFAAERVPRSGSAPVEQVQTETARRGSCDAPSRCLRQRGRSVHAGAAFEEQGLADRRLHRAFLERFGDQEGRLRSFAGQQPRSEEHTSELQSLMRISYAVFCLKKKKNTTYRKIFKQHTK